MTHDDQGARSRRLGGQEARRVRSRSAPAHEVPALSRVLAGRGGQPAVAPSPAEASAACVPGMAGATQPASARSMQVPGRPQNRGRGLGQGLGEHRIRSLLLLANDTYARPIWAV
eukprot:scaffold102705_cov30-Phaeocystis_antarctica.AAC.1